MMSKSFYTRDYVIGILVAHAGMRLAVLAGFTIMITVSDVATVEYFPSTTTLGLASTVVVE